MVWGLCEVQETEHLAEKGAARTTTDAAWERWPRNDSSSFLLQDLFDFHASTRDRSFATFMGEPELHVPGVNQDP